MNAQGRIYKPGARSETYSQSEGENQDSGHSRNGSALPAAAAEFVDDPLPKAFPLECLPEPCAGMARAIAKTDRTPESLAGCCILGILSASIGAGLQVVSGPSRLTRGNVYILISAESGSGKSETFRRVVRPFTDFEAGIVEKWREHVLPEAEAERDILESEISALKKAAVQAQSAEERQEMRSKLEGKKRELAASEARMRPPVLCCEDVTTEKLAVMLSERGECMASLSPDAGTIVNNLLGRYSKLDRTDETIYLKGFSGDYCRVDRQGRESVVLRSPCVTVVWFTQPDKVETLLGKRSFTDGGLIPRLLICHSNAEPREIDDDPAEIPASVSSDYQNLIRELLKTYRLAETPLTIQVAPQATAAFKDHYNAVVHRWKPGEVRDIGSFALRWTEQAWRIAVCLHAGKHGRHAHERLLELATTKLAIEIADWFAGQQLKILSAGREATRKRKRDDVFELLADKTSGITSRDVHRARIAQTSEQARELLQTLETEGALFGRDMATGGRPSRIYTRLMKSNE